MYYPPENPDRPRDENMKKLIFLIEELITVVQEHDGVIKRDEAHQIVAKRLGISSQDLNYAGTNAVADKFLRHSFRSNEYTLGSRVKQF